MRRREFLGVLGSATATWPLAAQAQQTTKLPVVGYLDARQADKNQYLTAAIQGLGETGNLEGKNVAFEYRWGNDRVESMPALAAELVHRRVNVIAAFGTTSARAAKDATSTIPIVFLTGDDPINIGLVTVLNRPTGNLTGVTFISATLGAKRLEFLRILVPSADLIAILADQHSSESQSMSRDVQDAARSLGQPFVAFNTGTDDDIDSAFANLARQKVKAFLNCGSPFQNSRRERFAMQATRYAIPGIYTNRDFATAGGLISYGASLSDAYKQAGIYLGRILKGEKLAELPIVQPTKFDLVINLSTAKALGLAIPETFLLRANEVIE